MGCWWWLSLIEHLIAEVQVTCPKPSFKFLVHLVDVTFNEHPTTKDKVILSASYLLCPDSHISHDGALGLGTSEQYTLDRRSVFGSVTRRRKGTGTEARALFGTLLSPCPFSSCYLVAFCR